jgi:hypothetical protein
LITQISQISQIEISVKFLNQISSTPISPLSLFSTIIISKYLLFTIYYFLINYILTIQLLIIMSIFIHPNSQLTSSSSSILSLPSLPSLPSAPSPPQYAVEEQKKNCNCNQFQYSVYTFLRDQSNNRFSFSSDDSISQQILHYSSDQLDTANTKSKRKYYNHRHRECLLTKKKKKRKAIESSSSPLIATPVIMSPLANVNTCTPPILCPPPTTTSMVANPTYPLVDYENNHSFTWEHYGYALIRGAACQLATDHINKMFAVEKNRAEYSVGWTRISGGVHQIETNQLEDCNIQTVNELSKELEITAKKELKKILSHDEYSSLNIDSMRLDPVKWLNAKHNTGRQSLHLDSLNYNNITVLLYCSNTMSTDLPILPLKSSIHDRLSWKDKKLIHVWYEYNYHSVSVKPGDLLLFKHNCIHRGTLNQFNHDRDVIYGRLTHEEKVVHAEVNQYFSWIWAAELFSVNSREYAAMLTYNNEYKPLDHIIANKKEQTTILKSLSSHTNNLKFPVSK